LISPEQVNPWHEVLAASLLSIWHRRKKQQQHESVSTMGNKNILTARK
jgi:hypothetical protein